MITRRGLTERVTEREKEREMCAWVCKKTPFMRQRPCFVEMTRHYQASMCVGSGRVV